MRCCTFICFCSPSYTWWNFFFFNFPLFLQVVGTSPNLTFAVSHENSGRYYCKASIMGFAEIGAEASVYLKGAPSIRSSRRQFGIPGDTARVECIAFSVPKAKHVIWTFNGHEINTSNDHDYSILEDPLPEGIKSTLIVRESSSKHFGKYNCTVVNEYGNDTLEIELMAQSKMMIFFLQKFKREENFFFFSALCKSPHNIK